MPEQVPTEAQEHLLLVAYLRVHGYRFTHVANETGTSNKWIGVRNKRNGVSPGFPDFLIIVRRRLVAIELKRQKKAWATAEQTAWLEALAVCGIDGRVCKGFDAARQFIEELEEEYGKDKQTDSRTGGSDPRFYSEVDQQSF